MQCQHAALHAQLVLVNKEQQANYSNLPPKRKDKEFRHTPAIPRVMDALFVLTAWQKAKHPSTKASQVCAKNMNELLSFKFRPSFTVA